MESVWDYPRPPRVEPCARRAAVEVGGVTVADSANALRVLETSQAPAIYFPPADVRMELLQPVGRADVLRVEGGGRVLRHRGRGPALRGRGLDLLRSPTLATTPIRGHFAFYPQRVDRCLLGDERVEPNEGDFYGGWITSDIQGPFKGGPGSRGW